MSARGPATPSNCRMGITTGDPAGIGPEVTLKALARLADSTDDSFLIFGHAGQLLALNRELGLSLPLAIQSEAGAAARWIITAPSADAAQPSPQGDPRAPADFAAGSASPSAARASLAWLTAAAQACLRGELAGLITGPVSKQSIMRTGQRFVGQTEHLAELAGIPDPVMMLLGQDDRGRWLRVALATTHLALRDVAAHVTAPKVQRAIEAAAAACSRLGLPRQRVGVCGLNPHAGEGGKLGDEEIRVIAPAIRAACKKGLEASGPWPADSLFGPACRGEFDAVVAMYHDQGLAPLKMVAFDSGVNWTLGLPFVRTSPDHGTAYDLAGRGLANPSSTIAAIRLARQLTSSGQTS
ncbi:MAG TPA: 4-hydroxythreonine-4-phosphate dehydrogenase PdxA [Candidatus Paceibacterota bacterium]|nr:4-hydroxythreonine-4-phosphate dehydrogenase PdxA [Candidatus Paceibacterota bacterium]HRZ92064.1 4-hydroxythreonine-4-phosphate dehydrogenase PdxA [Candidatus Paceibacterota bacterium]